jgi:hypothetical protein
VERKITSLIRMSGIPDDINKKLIPHAATPPRIYGLLKIHKGTPLIPIANCIGLLTYNLAKQLKPLVGQSDHITNSGMFVQKLKDI